MSGQDLHLFPNNAASGSAVVRPSKLPLFGRRASEKQLQTQPGSSTTSPLGRVRPATVVKPFFAASHHTHHQHPQDDGSQRRRYPASQPSTPVRSGVSGGAPVNMGSSGSSHEYQQLHRSARKRTTCILFFQFMNTDC